MTKSKSQFLRKVKVSPAKHAIKVFTRLGKEVKVTGTEFSEAIKFKDSLRFHPGQPTTQPTDQPIMKKSNSQK